MDKNKGLEDSSIESGKSYHSKNLVLRRRGSPPRDSEGRDERSRRSMVRSEAPGNQYRPASELGPYSRSRVKLVPRVSRDAFGPATTYGRNRLPAGAEREDRCGSGSLAKELPTRRRSRARDSRSPERSSSAGRWAPRRPSSPKGKGCRNSGGGSCSQETEWETESEEDGRESEMVPKGHSSGPLLQEAYTTKGSEEEEQQLFEFKDLRLFQHIGRGLRLGASASGHQQASSRLPGQAVRQGSHQDVGQSDRGRTGRVSGLQPVLPPGSTRKGGDAVSNENSIPSPR